MEEKLTQSDNEMFKMTVSLEQAGDKQLQDQQKLEADEIGGQLQDAAQAAIDKVNQELAQIPQKIEDDLDAFNKTLKSLMNKNVDPRVDVNSPEFDGDIAIGDFKKLLDPLIGAISPIESIVGKVPLIGDIMGAISKLTANNDNGGLTKTEIKLRVPNKPEIPTSLINKVNETCQTVQEFCFRLPMLLIDVIFQMLNAIFDMFNQIAGVIGVPSFPFPFNLVTSMPSMMSKVEDFVTSAPSQVKNIVMGQLKEKFAAAQALSVPKPPEPSQLAAAAKAKAESAANTAAGEASPKPVEKPPIESPVVSTPPVQSVPPSAPKNLSMDEVKAKWSKRFADDFNYGEEDITKTIDTQLKVFDGSNEEITKVSDSLVNPVTQLKRRTYSAEDVDRWMSGTYKHQKEIPWITCYAILKANQAIDCFTNEQKKQIDMLKSMGDKEVVVQMRRYPKKSFLSWIGF